MWLGEQMPKGARNSKSDTSDIASITLLGKFLLSHPAPPHMSNCAQRWVLLGELMEERHPQVTLTV